MLGMRNPILPFCLPLSRSPPAALSPSLASLLQLFWRGQTLQLP